MLDPFACDPAPIVFRSVLPAFLADVGRSHLLVARLGGALGPLGSDPALVVIRLALSAFGPEVGRPGRPAEVAGGLLRAEELVQQAGVVRLGRNRPVLQATPQTVKLLAARTSSLRRAHGGDQQQGHDTAKPGRDRQQPAHRVAADGVVEDRDLAGGGVLPDQVGHHNPTGDRQHEQ